MPCITGAYNEFNGLGIARVLWEQVFELCEAATRGMRLS